MAIVAIPDEDRTLTEQNDIKQYLATIGIDYQRWDTSRPVADDAPADEVLKAYSAEIDKLKSEGGYVTADVIDVNPQTPGLETMLAKFNREHWHDEDEVRFIIRGRGIFHIHPPGTPVVAIEVEAGDLIRVPRGTLHWFNLCETREIRAIRLFQDPAGWAPNYSESGIDAGYQPVCLGYSYFPASGASI
jgi:1,2-dihydroxy-3-keto-5-methylthiopentene dioxygenase